MTKIRTGVALKPVAIDSQAKTKVADLNAVLKAKFQQMNIIKDSDSSDSDGDW